MTITDEFKKATTGKEFDSNLLVPLNSWLSGYQSNIETTQLINYMFTNVNKEVLSHKLTLNNKLTHFLKYPKGTKDNPKLYPFFRDLGKYFGWSIGETKKNISLFELNETKEFIAKTFGYTNVERKEIGLKKVKHK